MLGLNQIETSVLIHAKQDIVLEPDETFFALLQLTKESYEIGVRLEEETSITTVIVIDTNGNYNNYFMLNSFSLVSCKP